MYAILVFLTAGGFFVQDYFGRRFLLMSGGVVMAGSLIGVAGITTVTPSPSGGRANACVALSTLPLSRTRSSRASQNHAAFRQQYSAYYSSAVFVWLAAFTQSWTNIPWTVSAELPSDALRDKTLAIGAFGGYVVGMLIGLVNPYMQNAEYGNLGGKGEASR